MKPLSILTHPIFITSVFLLTLHQILQKTGILSIPLIDAYLDDFWAMPFLLSIFLIEQLLWQRRTTPLMTYEIFIFTLIIAVFFEEIVPRFNDNYTKDYWDYLMYALGSFLFAKTINHSTMFF